MRRGGSYRGGGTGEATASRTVRRCTPYLSANALIDIWLRCQSNRIAAYNSTLDPIPAPMRERTDEQRTTPKIRPTPRSTTQPSGVSPSDTPPGGANSECYARTTPSRRWGQNQEEQWGHVQ